MFKNIKLYKNGKCIDILVGNCHLSLERVEIYFYDKGEHTHDIIVTEIYENNQDYNWEKDKEK